MADFVESVDDMIARHFATDAIWHLRATKACDINERNETREILYQLIRASIVHARNQAMARNSSFTMSFDEAMRLVSTRAGRVTRRNWNIFRAVLFEDSFAESGGDGLADWEFDNCEGLSSGAGGPYNPTAEDRGATDWMIYQAPEEN